MVSPRILNREVLIFMKRFLSLGVLLGLGLLAFPVVGAPKDDKAEAKEALQALNDYIGEWKGSGAPAGARPGASGWTENFGWSWRFKGDDAWMTWAVRSNAFGVKKATNHGNSSRYNVVFALAVAACLPSGVKATLRTKRPPAIGGTWKFHSRSGLPDAVSQSLTRLS